jgi:hypothetical protein
MSPEERSSPSYPKDDHADEDDERAGVLDGPHLRPSLLRVGGKVRPEHASDEDDGSDTGD